MVWCFCVMWKNISLQFVFVSLVTAEIEPMTFPCTWMSKYSNTVYWIIYPFPTGSKCQNFSIFYVLIYIAHSSQFSWSSCLLLNQLMSHCFNYSFIIYRYLSQSFWAAVTEYHRLDGLIINIYFSWFSQEVQGQSMIDLVSVESPLPGLQMITFSWCPLHDGEWNNLSHVFSIRALIPFKRVPPSWPSLSQRPHLLVLSHWQLGLQHMNLNWWGHRHLVHNSANISLLILTEILSGSFFSSFCNWGIEVQTVNMICPWSVSSRTQGWHGLQMGFCWFLGLFSFPQALPPFGVTWTEHGAQQKTASSQSFYEEP